MLWVLPLRLRFWTFEWTRIPYSRRQLWISHTHVVSRRSRLYGLCQVPPFRELPLATRQRHYVWSQWDKKRQKATYIQHVSKLFCNRTATRDWTRYHRLSSKRFCHYAIASNYCIPIYQNQLLFKPLCFFNHVFNAHLLSSLTIYYYIRTAYPVNLDPYLEALQSFTLKTFTLHLERD